ncbi:MAG: hypothetical protein CVU78_05710 [Elusimicrobia bacterium HGW-Elusimicrobia-2]|nr:MAG: hypothetical protein CVU78_05710 [Elusimicrobia bacterium HGW-Elusimicrobia-2]
MKFIAEYQKHRKEQARAFAKLKSASMVIHPFAVFFAVLAAALTLWVILKTPTAPDVKKDAAVAEALLFNVGHGYSMLFITPSGKSILVDAGPPVLSTPEKAADFCLMEGKDVWKTAIKKYLERRKIKSLDYLILTSPAENFCGGAVSMFEEGFPVKKVLASGVYFPGPRFITYRNITEKAQKSGLLKNVAVGDVIYSEKDMTVQVLSPLIDYSGFENFDSNASMILRFVYGNTAVIYAGNAGLSALDHTAAYQSLKSDVLVTPNFCSGQTFSLSFMETAAPSICLVSSGLGNKEEYPNSKMLAFFDMMHIKYFRTDECDRIKLISDGKTIKAAKE